MVEMASFTYIDGHDETAFVYGTTNGKSTTDPRKAVPKWTCMLMIERSQFIMLRFQGRSK